MVNNKFEFEIEVLTPISIGSGAENDWVKGVDYVEKDNNFYLINLRKIFKSGIDVSTLSNYFSQKQDSAIVKILGSRLEEVSDAIFRKPCSTSIDIKSFVKNKLSGKPIIPGSSLKGAIRSILFKHLRKREVVEKDVFGSADKGDEFMRFIKISDVSFEKTELVNTKIFNLHGRGDNWRGGWKHKLRGEGSTTEQFDSQGFNTIYEVLEPGKKGIGSIMLAETAFNNYGVNEQKYGNAKEELLQIDNLFATINKHTSSYLRKELDFFKKYEAQNVDKIIENIEWLLESIPTDNLSCILKMSAGSGFHSITGDWKYNDYSDTGYHTDKKNVGKKNYKSRKIAIRDEHLSLMGFIKIRRITKEEKQRLIDKEKEEKYQKEQEKLAEKRKLEEDKRKLESYDELIKKADELFKNEKYENALEFYKDAGEILKEEKKHTSAIEEIEKILEKIQKEKEWEQLKLQSELEFQNHRNQQIEGGLSFLEEKFDDGRYKVSDFKGAKSRIEAWMKKANVSVLPTNELDMLTTSLMRFYSGLIKEKDRKIWQTQNEGIWHSVKNWVGEHKTKELFDMIIK